MARRRVVSITVEGFGSYGVPQTLTLDGSGPVAIVGDNGAGKSTIASKALVWALFGKAAPERMGAATQALKGKAVVTDGKKEARVVVVVADSSGETWTIERTRGRTGGDKIAVASSVHGSLVEDDIPAIVGCTYEVFCRTVVRGQGDVWAFAEATDARKREILDEVSGATALAPLLEKAKALRDMSRAQIGTLDGQASVIRSRVTQAQARTRSLEAQRDDWERMHVEDLQRRQEHVETAERAEAQAAALDAQAASLEAQRTALEAQRPHLDWAPYQQAERAASDALVQARGVRSAAEARFVAVRDLAPGCTCPTCGQVIAPTAPVAVRRAAAEAPYLEAVEGEKRAQAGDAAAKVATAGARAWLEAAEAQHNQKLAALPARVLSGQLAAAQAATRGARDALATAQAAVNPYTAGVDVANAEEARLARDLAVLEEALVGERERYRYAETAVAALSPKGAPAGLAESTLTAIEVEASRWLDALSQGTMALAFRRGTGDRIETVIHVRERASGAWIERDLINFSGGERARINMACDLGVAAAFDAAGTAVSLLVLDEAVFSGLDSAGQAAIVMLLHGAGVADVVVVDHSPALSGALPRAMKATIGADGYTRLQEVRCHP